VVQTAASYAELDGTFPNNDGMVQRVRQTILPLHQAKPDRIITSQLAKKLGLDFGYQLSASAVFRDIAEHVAAYSGMRYPLLKDETNPIQAKYEVHDSANIAAELQSVRSRVELLPDDGDKIDVAPEVGHELFRIGGLTGKVEQFHLLASGNPRPETTAISPLYQITVGG
jgi:NADH dehydrogenase/NADH:ubiquinone oxidoreductase subunit G